MKLRMKKILTSERLVRVLRLLVRIAALGLLGYLLVADPMTAVAQNYDYGSVEAYINDHKRQRSLLQARATLEYGNQLLHRESSGSATDYKEVNIDLDRYTRAFDIIDAVYQSLRAAVNVYHTYDDVSETIVNYKDILDDFNQKIILRGRVELLDTCLIAINYRAIRNISTECEYLYRSVRDLVLYTTGVASCSTSDLVMLLESINGSLENIRAMVKNAYLAAWRYIQVRTGYWKEKVYRPSTKKSIAEKAILRWLNVGLRNLPH